MIRYERTVGDDDLPVTVNSRLVDLQYSFYRALTSIGSRSSRFKAQIEGLLVWIRTRTSDVGETPLHMHTHQQLFVVRKQGTYRRWAGVQDWLSRVCNSSFSFSINNLSV